MKKIMLAGLVASALVGPFSACKKCDEKAQNLDFAAAFVVNGADNSLSVIDLQTEAVRATIGFCSGSFPHHIYASPDGQKLAVAMVGGDLSGGHAGHGGGSDAAFSVNILNAKTGELLHQIELSKMPHNAVFSPDGAEIWLGQTDAAGSEVQVFDAEKFTLLQTISVGKGLSEITFAADGSVVFAVSTDAATVAVIDPATKIVGQTIAVGAAPVGAWPGGQKMFVDEEGAKAISVVDVPTRAVESTILLGFKPGYAAFHAPSGRLWVSNADAGSVVVFEKASAGWAKIADISTGADAHAIAFSKDGQMAWVSNQGAATVSKIDVLNLKKLGDVAVGAKPNGILLLD